MTLSQDQIWSLITLAIFLFILAIWVKMKPGGQKKPTWWIVAAALIGIGIYFFPMGAIDAYELTQTTFHLSYIENYVLWLLLCTTLIAAGLMIIIKKRGRK